MIETRVTLKWNGQQVEQQLKNRININLDKALTLFYNKLRELINKWGSFGGKRVVHSQPGEPPRRQTANLYNSIKKEVISTVDGVEGAVFTDVPYAPTLEYGGELQVTDRPHASVELSNPFINAITIAPRPAWGPAFAEVGNEMNDIMAE